ncbi:MAG: tetratricopeptide repeat protein [Planctomycetota bacterium]
MTTEIERAAVRNPAATPLASSGSPKSDFELLYQSSLDSLEGGDPQAALKTINRALQLVDDERYQEAIAVRGYIHYQLGNQFEAIQDCTEAIDAGWWDARTFAWRAAAYAAEQRWPESFADLDRAQQLAGSGRARYEQLQLSYLAEAEVYYLAELEKYPNNPPLLRQLGWCYLQSGANEKAGPAFQRCLQIDEHEAWAWLGKARISRSLQEWPQAEFAAQRAAGAAEPEVAWLGQLELARIQQLSGSRGAAALTLKDLQAKANRIPKRLLALAELYQDLGNPAASLQVLKHLLEFQPEHLPAILSRAAAFRRLQNYPLEVAEYHRYLKLRPNDQRVLLARAQAELAIQQFDAAVEDANEALQLDVLETDAYLVRAAVFHARQDYSAGLSEIEHALKLDNRYPPAYLLRGKLQVGLAQFSEALDDFSRALELLSPEETRLRGEAHYFRGTTRFELQQFREAVTDFEQAIRCQPAHAGAWVWLANAKSKLGQWNEAVQFLLRAQAAQPNLARNYRLLGGSIANRAVEEFTRVLPTRDLFESQPADNRFRSDGIERLDQPVRQQEVEPQVQSARIGRAMAYQYLAQYEPAVRDYSLALQTAPEELDLWFRRGQVWQQLGEDRRARHDLAHVIHRQPEHHLARFYRAVSAARCGDTERAISDLIKAIRISPNHTRYHLLRGELNARLGRLSKAIRSFYRAESLEPNNPAVYRFRGEARWKKGQTREALADWTRSLELNADQGDVYALRGKARLRTGDPQGAKSDFEQAIRLKPQNLMAVIGRADALSACERSQAALLWLTKSFHRFSNPRGLADLLLARGRVYYSMGAWSKAAADADMALDLRRDHLRVHLAARYLRARALIQSNQLANAARDVRKILRLQPDHPGAMTLSRWLQDPTQPRPPELQAPLQKLKFNKPQIVRAPLQLNGSAEAWNAEGPFDNWILRDRDRREFGPVTKAVLNDWVEQGRIGQGMRLLRGDWSKWKRAEKVYPELAAMERK